MTSKKSTPSNISRRSILQNLGAASAGGLLAGLALAPEQSEAASGTVPGAVKLVAAAQGGTTVVVNIAPDPSGTRGWVILDPYTLNCEIRQIASISGTTITLTKALNSAFTHAIGTTVLWADSPVWNVRLFGAKGDGDINANADDTTAIQNAINDGYHVFLPEGIYVIRAPLILHDDVVVEGAGDRSVLQAEGTEISGFLNRYVIGNGTAAYPPQNTIDPLENVTLRHFKITNAKRAMCVSFYRASHLTIEGLTLIQPTQVAPNASDTTYVTAGITIYQGSTDVTITNCYIEAPHLGALFQGAGDNEYVERILFSNNIVIARPPNYPTNGNEMVKFDYLNRHVHIVNNIICGGYLSCITMEEQTYDAIIANNTLDCTKVHKYSTGDTWANSAQITDVQNVSTWNIGDYITGNYIPAGTTVTAINEAAKTLTISNVASTSGNNIHLYDADTSTTTTSDRGLGIRIEMGQSAVSETVRHLQIVGNTIRKAGTGIYVGSQAALRYAKMANNVIHDCKKGVDLRGSDVTFSDNTIFNSEIAGITAQGVNLTVQNNVVRNTGTLGTPGPIGIDVRSGSVVSGLTVRGNVVDGFKQWGIVGNKYHGAVIADNVLITDEVLLQSNQHYPIYIFGNANSDASTTESRLFFITGNMIKAPSANYGIALRYVGTIHADNNLIHATNRYYLQAADYVVVSDQGQVSSGSAAPTRGMWGVGDRIYRTTPMPGGYVGWVCTTAGKAHAIGVGTITQGSNLITDVEQPGTWEIGDIIRGVGIPANTTVTAKTGNTLTISNNATSSLVDAALYDAVFREFGEIRTF